MAMAYLKALKTETGIADEVHKWNADIKLEWKKLEEHLDRKRRKGEDNANVYSQ